MNRWLSVLIVLVAWPRGSFAEDRYLVMLFSSQSQPVRAERTHSFMTAVRLSEGAIADVRTISWMPASLKICARCILPKPGRNLDLSETLEWAACDGQVVKAWGPFEIRPELYGQILCQEVRLNSGRVRYQCFDRYSSQPGVSNCFHAITDVVRHPRALYPLYRFGEAATANIVRQWRRRGLLGPCRPEDWPVFETLGLARVPGAEELCDPDGSVRNGAPDAALAFFFPRP